MNKRHYFNFPDRVLNLYANSIWEYKLLNEFRKGLKKSNSLNTLPLKASTIPPIIVLGMHRSGTTITSRLLRESGVFMGNLRGRDTDESFFFQNINKAIFSIAHSQWDVPESLKEALEEEHFRNGVTRMLLHFANTSNSQSFRGLTTRKGHSLLEMKQLWGWKDPRTCFTLALWMQIFPKAKVLFVYRNGVDVAHSLYVRNKKLLWRKPSSVRCLSLNGAFKIWELYNQECLAQIGHLPSKQLHMVKYEDLLLEPETTLQQMFRFVEVESNTTDFQKITGRLKGSRAYAFKNDKSLNDLYNEKRNTQMMVKLKYDSITE